MKGLDYSYLDEGTATEHLIHTIIKSKVNTVLPAEVVDIQKDKVSVRSLVMPMESDYPAVVYHNVMVVVWGGGGLKINYPLKSGDQGLLVTCKLDITNFKKTRAASKTSNSRVFDSNDSVFIPLVFNKEDLSKDELVIDFNGDNLVIKGKSNLKIMTEQVRVAIDDKNVLVHTQNGEAEVIASKVKLNCRELVCPPLKKALTAIQDLMDALAQGMKGGATAPVEYNAAKPVKNLDIDGVQ